MQVYIILTAAVLVVMIELRGGVRDVLLAVLAVRVPPLSGRVVQMSTLVEVSAVQREILRVAFVVRPDRDGARDAADERRRANAHDEAKRSRLHGPVVDSSGRRVGKGMLWGVGRKKDETRSFGRFYSIFSIPAVQDRVRYYNRITNDRWCAWCTRGRAPAGFEDDFLCYATI